MEEIVIAEKDLHTAVIRALSQDYLCWVVPIINNLYHTVFSAEEIIEQDMLTLDKFMPPKGRLVLAYSDGYPAGIAGVKELQDRTGEIKRMFVRPEYRNRGLGRTICSKLIDEARLIGYETIRLDSAKFMDSAHRLYRSFGFVDIQPYEGSEIPKEYQSNWVFMEKTMGTGSMEGTAR